MKLAPLDSAHIKLSIHAKKFNFYEIPRVVPFLRAGHICNFFIIYNYRIAGNFRGRKLSRNVKTGRIMGVPCLEFRGENFRGWLKNGEIRKSFLPRNFLAIRYTMERAS